MLHIAVLERNFEVTISLRIHEYLQNGLAVSARSDAAMVTKHVPVNGFVTSYSFNECKRWGLHLTVVMRFEYADDPKSYASGSVASGRACHAGKFEG